MIQKSSNLTLTPFNNAKYEDQKIITNSWTFGVYGLYKATRPTRPLNQETFSFSLTDNECCACNNFINFPV